MTGGVSQYSGRDCHIESFHYFPGLLACKLWGADYVVEKVDGSPPALGPGLAPAISKPD